MSLQINLERVAKIIEAKTDSPLMAKIATGITTDTRDLQAGNLFIALKGENFDGHNFSEIAIDQGAIALITSTEVSIDPAKQIPQLIVKDTLEAYQNIARWWRDRFNVPVIGITGSVGKTTTKELIAAVLATSGKVLKTEANYNNEIGVPKTLLGLNSAHQYAVIEMAMRARGEIATLTHIANPTIGLITNVGTAHIGRLGSEEAIAQAKCELLAEMDDTNIAIINHDNQLLVDTAATVWQGETVTYGLEGGDLQGELIDDRTLRVGRMDFSLPLLGRHNALNYLAALAVAKVLGIDWTVLQDGLTVELPKGRARRYQLDHDIVVLDETYNASVESTIAALQMLKETPGKRHVAVLGTMKELGVRSQQLHYRVGEIAKNLNLDCLLILADEEATYAIEQGAQGIAAECFHTHQDLVQRLQEIAIPGDRILFKASNSVGLNRVVEEFCSYTKSV